MKHPVKTYHFSVESSEIMVEFGHGLGELMTENMVVYLVGALAAGKTTLTRGILTALGHRGSVKSPTYSYVEPYMLGDRVIYHFDLYRLGVPQELEEIGVRDYFCEEATVLIEWPERGINLIPKPEIVIQINPDGDAVDKRLLSITPLGSIGRGLCKQLATYEVASGYWVSES